jgi:hypothetical protein
MKLGSVGVVAVLVALAAAAVAAAALVKHSTLVLTTISPTLKITFAPKTVRLGTAVFKVVNGSVQAHEFTIDNVTSRWIPPHGSGSITVTFKRPAVYQATLPDCGYLSTCVGGNPDTGPTGYLNVLPGT